MSRFLFLSLLLIQQPIPYSHKTHVTLGVKCAYCHTMPGKGEAATFPDEAKCMACHDSIKKDSSAIQTLADYYSQKKPVPWKRVYLLPENIWFSHKRHATSTCETCHGPVAERDVIVKEKPTTMASCMACHDETQAPNECNTCHNP